jgi:hypothetical protein
MQYDFSRSDKDEIHGCLPGYGTRFGVGAVLHHNIGLLGGRGRYPRRV